MLFEEAMRSKSLLSHVLLLILLDIEVLDFQLDSFLRDYLRLKCFEMSFRKEKS